MEQQKPLNGKQLIDLLTSSVVDEDVLVDYELFVADQGEEWAVMRCEIVSSQDAQGKSLRRIIITI